MKLTKKQLVKKLMDGEKLTCDGGTTYCYYDEDCVNPFMWTDKSSKSPIVDSWSKTEWEIYKEPYKPWVPADGKKAYWINGHGDIASSLEWGKKIYNVELINQGSVFRTRKEAEQEVAWRRARHILKQEIARLNEGYKPDWAKNNYCVVYGYTDNSLLIAGTTFIKYHKDWFYLKSDKLAEQLIETHSKELQIYLGV